MKNPISITFEKFSGELASGSIKMIHNFPSKLVRPRDVAVWLPSDYSENKNYAVLYMHDGQMLFDSNMTWNKQEWMVDEILGELLSEKKINDCIVVAISNHSDIRRSDYYPKKPFEKLSNTQRESVLSNNAELTKYGIQSDNYLEFIVKEVKPFIDSSFSTYKDYKNTFISGSSMGGLISMYAMCEYPNVFGGAACLSTHWSGVKPVKDNPIPNTFFEYLEEKLPSPKTHKIYFDYGTETLDKYYLPYQKKIDTLLESKGYDDTNSRNLKFEGHDHSENSWNQRFQIPVQFLLNIE
jgi:predicted alpha/beta superfamily hydrolase